MKPNLCQSCGFPIFEENKGTNRDNSKNDDYCTNCYQNGVFFGLCPQLAWAAGKTHENGCIS